MIVARSSLNNYDVTANSSFWFCPFCSKKVKIGGNAMYYRRWPLDFSSSSESSVSSCSDEVSSSDSSDTEIESVLVHTDPSHQQEEKQKQQVVPFDIDEDDEGGWTGGLKPITIIPSPSHHSIFNQSSIKNKSYLKKCEFALI